MVRFTLVNPETGREIDLMGLIDTGADRCAVPVTIAEILGYDLSQCPVSIVKGVGSVRGYNSLARIKIRSLTFDDVPCVFLERVEMVVALGTENFLEHFLLRMNYPRDIFEMIYPVQK